jgi:hypothetical protein
VIAVISGTNQHFNNPVAGAGLAFGEFLTILASTTGKITTLVKQRLNAGLHPGGTGVSPVNHRNQHTVLKYFKGFFV